jgi:hypothetical protein
MIGSLSNNRTATVLVVNGSAFYPRDIDGISVTRHEMRSIANIPHENLNTISPRQFSVLRSLQAEPTREWNVETAAGVTGLSKNEVGLVMRELTKKGRLKRRGRKGEFTYAVVS